MKRTLPSRTSSSSAQRFLDRRLRIRPMQLVKVDPIGVEPLQARFHSAQDVGARRAFELALIIHRQAEFGREHDLFALWSKNSPELLLRASPGAVSVGGVQSADANIRRMLRDPVPSR